MSLRAVVKTLYIITLSVIVAGGLVYSAVIELGETSRKLNKLSLQKEAVKDLQISLTEVLMPGNDYLITGNKEENENFIELDRNVKDQISNVKLIVTDESVRQVVARIQSEYDQIREVEQKILNIPNPTGNSNGSQLMDRWMQ